MLTNRSWFSTILPEDMKNKIEDELPASDQGRLASTCYGFYAHGLSSHSEITFNTRIRHTRKQVQKLLNHVIRGEQAQAEIMLRQDPGLSLEKGKVQDYSGRTIYGTALQMALGAEDIRYHANEKCMTEVILYNMQKLPEAKTIIATQVNEQFPQEYIEQQEEHFKKGLSVLQAVLEAIMNATQDDDCEEALQNFRAYFKPQGVIQTGKHFNIELLLAALNLYKLNYSALGGHGSEKNQLFWCKVIGYIERYLPACYAQALSQGISDIMHTRKFKRQKSLAFDEGVEFFPLDKNTSDRLGFHYGIGGDLLGDGIRLYSYFSLGHRFYENLVNFTKIKNRHIEETCIESRVLVSGVRYF